MSQLRRLWVSSGGVVPVLLLLLSALPARGQARVSTIGEVIDGWSPETHLYVLGDVDLQEPVLAELEAWLKDRHWTVLLVQDAAGQRFRDVDGVLHLDQEAVRYGAGQGITRAPGFAGQVHPDTKEPDGAILSILLAQRTLYYSGSQAQDSRGMGETAFQGDLDQWAIAALRNGGDVVSAVKNTVMNVDARLAGAIGEEREQAARYLAWGRRRVSDAETQAALLEANAAALPAAARPDTGSLRQGIERAQALLDEEKAAEAIALLESVFQEIRLQQSNIDLYRVYTDRLAEYQAQLDRLRSRRTLDDAARREIRKASRIVAAARDEHRRAGIGGEQVDRAGEAVRSAEDAARRAEGLKVLFGFLGLALLGALAGYARFLNRRRRPVKEEAEALLASWQTALDRKLEALVGELEPRVERRIGPVSGDGRRFAGETDRLARQVRSDVGSLTILWTSARSVLEQAAERIRPRRPGPILYNLLFPGSYLRGLALLRDEPVPFDPADGLPRLFGSERTWREDLLGDLASYEPFRKSFEELTEELHTRAARAAGALDELEASLHELPLLAEKTHERIWQAGLQKDYLAEAGAGDGLFLVPAVFSEALPAATAALEEAQGTAAADPVGTRRGSAARAERLAADAWRLAGLCRGVRSAVLPVLQSAEARLREAGLPTAWIGEGLQSLSGRAAELASRAAAEAVSAEIETLAVDLAAFQARVERAVELWGRLGETRARIANEETRVESCRGEMGAGLGLAPDLLLREKGADPSERLMAAALDSAEVQAHLGRGQVEEAAAALESADWQATEAAVIVDASRKTFDERETAVGERRAETERLAALLPQHELVLAGTRDSFAESALGLGAGDEIHPGADATVVDNADEAREEIAAARGKLDLAVAGLREGRMLAAASLLRQVRGHQEQTGFRLAEITAKRARLDRAREDNRGLLAKLEARAAKTGPDLAGDPRITQPTRDAFEAAAGRLRAARGWIDRGREDPLAAAQELLAAEDGLDRVDMLAPRDRELHARAAKALEQAREAVEEASSWSSLHGVIVPGQPGINELSAADRLLREGRYEESRLAAGAARETADAAMEEIRAEVSRRRIVDLRSSSGSSSSSDWPSSDSGSSSGSSSSDSSSSGSGSSGWSGSDSGSGSSSWSGSDSGSGESHW